MSYISTRWMNNIYSTDEQYLLNGWATSTRRISNIYSTDKQYPPGVEKSGKLLENSKRYRQVIPSLKNSELSTSLYPFENSEISTSQVKLWRLEISMSWRPLQAKLIMEYHISRQAFILIEISSVQMNQTGDLEV